MTAGPTILQRLRLGAALTQQEVADRVNARTPGASVDRKTISRWEHGRVVPQPLYRRALADVFGIDPADLGPAWPAPPPPRGTGHVFLSTPMAALDSAAYEADRAAAGILHSELQRLVPPVYWAAAEIGTTAEFEVPDLAAERNLTALAGARAFVYLQLRDLAHPTSCHVEIGIALARHVPVTIFAPSERALPYTLRRFEAISGRAGIGARFRFYAAADATDAVRLLTIHGPELLGLPATRTRRGARLQEQR